MLINNKITKQDLINHYQERIDGLKEMFYIMVEVTWSKNLLEHQLQLMEEFLEKLGTMTEEKKEKKHEKQDIRINKDKIRYITKTDDWFYISFNQKEWLLVEALNFI